MSLLLCLLCKLSHLSRRNAGPAMRQFVPNHSPHSQDLTFALNQSRLLPDPRFFLPLPSLGSCYCLSCTGQRAGLAVFDTDTQSPPDPRMNRSSEHSDRLSLGRLLVLTSSVTRPTQLVFESAFPHYLLSPSSLLVATFVCNKNIVFPYLCERLRPLLRVPAKSSRGSFYRRQDTSRSSLPRSELYRIPSSWPAP